MQPAGQASYPPRQTLGGQIRLEENLLLSFLFED
jgi:hypothetical protein